MKKDYLKYLIFAVAILCIPLFIDDVFASSTFYAVPTDGSAIEYLYRNNDIVASQNFGTRTTVVSNYLFSYISSSSLGDYLGGSMSYKLVWSMQGSLINKYDSFSFTQGFFHANATDVIFWITVNGLIDGFIPCTLTTDNSDSDFQSERYSSFVCEYDNTRIKDSDNVQLSFTTFFTPFYKDISMTTAFSPRVYTINTATFFTKDEQVIVDTIKQQTDAINKQTESFDEFKNTDIDDSQKELPDDSSFKEYESVEGELLDKVNQADMDVLDIGIDAESSNFVWDTTTKLIQSHPAVFGMFISILSIGIIKLALGR